MPNQAYSSPPIVEAHVELQFASSIDVGVQSKIYGRLSDRYPNENQNIRKNYELKVETEELNSTSTEVITRGSSYDEADVLLIGPKILSVSRMAPYTSWDNMREQIANAYTECKKMAGYRKINRIGVRYVNRVDLEDDQGRVEYEDYFNLHINLPRDFPDLTAYQLAFRSGLDDIRCSVSVVSGVVEPVLIGYSSFILDIDVAREVDVPQRDDKVFELLEAMRHAKNSLFETFVTDKARELFDAD